MPMPASAEAGTRLARRAVGFVRLLRDNGFPVGIGEARDALRLVGEIDLATPHELRWSLRTLLCCSRTDWRRFDELFDAHWLRHGMRQAKLGLGGTAPGGARPRRTGPLIDHRFGPDDRAGRAAQSTTGAGPDDRFHRAGASRREALGSTDLRHVHDPEEQRKVHDLAERLAARMRHRLARRRRLRSRGRQLDLRRVIHRSIQSGGLPLRLAYRRRHPKPIRLVVILDVSGSMNPYSTFFVRFLRGVLTSFESADGFVFHTRLVHLGEVLRERSSERAIERMAVLAEGWAGGTRIGECLATFNRRYAASVLNRRSVVVIVSDGYDTGPSERLAAEMAELKRRARRIVWLNPLLGWDGYRPLAGGMAAALPHVDLFAPAHDLASLAALEAALVRL